MCSMRDTIIKQMGLLKTEAADFWNQNPCGGEWVHYRQFIEWYLATEPYMVDIFKDIGLGKKHVLDVGCGQGVLSNWMAEQGAMVVGMDMSRTSLLATKKGAQELRQQPSIHLVQADAEHLPFGMASFELVTSIGVLHHTPDIQAAIAGISHILKQGGQVLVMLYRKGNPKWWATKTIRTISALVKRLFNKRRISSAGSSASKGTALMELLDVPIMNAYSNKEALRLFSAFHDARVSNYQPGFLRLADFFGWLKGLRPILGWIDERTRRGWGFYQVIEAQK